MSVRCVPVREQLTQSARVKPLTNERRGWEKQNKRNSFRELRYEMAREDAVCDAVLRGLWGERVYS